MCLVYDLLPISNRLSACDLPHNVYDDFALTQWRPYLFAQKLSVSILIRLDYEIHLCKHLLIAFKYCGVAMMYII